MRVLFFLALLSLLCASCSAQWCLNESGEAVDWWVAIKAPRLSASKFTSVAAGRAYIYGDAKSILTNTFWRNSSKLVTDADSAMGRTVGQIYANANKAAYGYALYSDQTPDGTTSTNFAHAKGHLAWSANSAFWFIHSVPRWGPKPAPNETAYSYPTSGQENGQSMMCISLSADSLDAVFLQMQYMNPLIYGKKWVAELTARLPNGDALINRGKVMSGSASNASPIRSVGGKKFMHFAKSGAWGQSIFGNLVAPFYGETMLVETWQRPYEEPSLPPASMEAVYSVLNIQLPRGANWDDVTWKMSQDHAKWGIVQSAKVPVVCVGDINKQKSQWKRGGGMMCITDQTLHAAYTGLILRSDMDGSRPKFLFNETMAEE